MKTDYAGNDYRTLSAIERQWLRVLLWYYKAQAEADTRVIARILDEVERGIAEEAELQSFKLSRIGYWNKANAIKARLERG